MVSIRDQIRAFEDAFFEARRIAAMNEAEMRARADYIANKLTADLADHLQPGQRFIFDDEKILRLERDE